MFLYTPMYVLLMHNTTSYVHPIYSALYTATGRCQA